VDPHNVLLRWTSSDTGKTDVMELRPHELIRRWFIVNDLSDTLFL
jgi:hypothetical protein